MKVSLNNLYKLVGTTKQAVSQYYKRRVVFNDQLRQLICEAEELRAEHPGCGVEKMYYTLKPDFLGRDSFIEIFMQLGFRLKKSKNFIRTTYSTCYKYQNLITGMVLNGANKIWQSDITYYRIGDDFYYIVFIIDVYTKVIVGYQTSDNLRAEANMKALKMALKQYGAPQIHHSDRGSQYGCKSYTDLLIDHEASISMGNIAQDNAYAERINRTIKEEYLDYWKPKSFKELKEQVFKAVNHYNTKRQHDGIFKYTPLGYYNYVINLPLPNRPMATIYAEGQKKIELTSSQLNLFAQQALQAHNCPNCLIINV
jgi:hypothetical protein